MTKSREQCPESVMSKDSLDGVDVWFIAWLGMNRDLHTWLEEDAALLAFLQGEEGHLFEAVISGVEEGCGTS